MGITEAGTGDAALIKSSVGIGALLAEGIGDTIRVSLSAEPEAEVKAAYTILQSLDLRRYYPEIISCPTCARARINIVRLAEQVNRLVLEQPRQDWKLPLKIAVMGCAVNGPGEAREADFGLAGGRGEGLFFRNGKIVGKVAEKDFLRVLKKEIAKHHGNKP